MQKSQKASRSTVIEKEAGASVYESLCKKINLNAVNSVIDIETFQSNEKMSESSADERITAAVSVFLKMIQESSQKVERLDKSLLDFHIARLDEQISRQLDEILHHEKFQEIESAWRGLAATAGGRGPGGVDRRQRPFGAGHSGGWQPCGAGVCGWQGALAAGGGASCAAVDRPAAAPAAARRAGADLAAGATQCFAGGKAGGGRA